jgi:hypothetical protein
MACMVFLRWSDIEQHDLIEAHGFKQFISRNRLQVSPVM